MTRPTIENTDAALKRWKTRLARAMTMIRKLEQQRTRLVKAEAKRAAGKAAEPIPAAGHMATLHDRYAAPAKPAASPDAGCGAAVTTPWVEPAARVTSLTLSGLEGPDANLDIPGFLRRQGPSPADVAAAEALKAEQAELKTAKARGRIATMKAKKSGDTKKMPLTGKAALALINSEE